MLFSNGPDSVRSKRRMEGPGCSFTDAGYNSGERGRSPDAGCNM